MPACSRPGLARGTTALYRICREPDAGRGLARDAASQRHQHAGRAPSRAERDGRHVADQQGREEAGGDHQRGPDDGEPTTNPPHGRRQLDVGAPLREALGAVYTGEGMPN